MGDLRGDTADFVLSFSKRILLQGQEGATSSFCTLFVDTDFYQSFTEALGGEEHGLVRIYRQVFEHATVYIHLLRVLRVQNFRDAIDQILSSFLSFKHFRVGQEMVLLQRIEETFDKHFEFFLLLERINQWVSGLRLVTAEHRLAVDQKVKEIDNDRLFDVIFDTGSSEETNHSL